MIPEQRRDFIYRYVHEKNAASFNELAELMSVSHMTHRAGSNALPRCRHLVV